ncbi:uncharacterized protein LOC123922126 [Trifolium pratense]|uniref:uncharacterized protein LOC123922126 n=1 Tax=Trifolium pratense TaxID=57577 RepID=UPI001E697D3C|nr:uncharacterized protein LOC123922126 [Trifolium pratense]
MDQYSCKQRINENTNNNDQLKGWTWDEDKGFEENLLEYLDKMILEGQLDKLVALVPERTTVEVKEHNQMIEEGYFEVPTYLDDCISKDNAWMDENKALPLKNKTKKVI